MTPCVYVIPAYQAAAAYTFGQLVATSAYVHPADNAYLSTDSVGNVYVSGVSSYPVVKLSSDLTTVSNPLITRAKQGGGMCVLSDGRVVKAYVNNGIGIEIYTDAGAFQSGFATDVNPMMIARDSSNNLYVGYSNATYQMRKFNLAGTLALTIPARGTNDVTVTVDAAGNIYCGYITDMYIVKYNSAGVEQWATTSGVSALDGQFTYLYTLDIGPDGNLWALDYSLGSVSKFNAATGAFMTKIATGMTNPTGMCISGNYLFVAGTGVAVRKFYIGGALTSGLGYVLGGGALTDIDRFVMSVNGTCSKILAVMSYAGYGGAGAIGATLGQGFRLTATGAAANATEMLTFATEALTTVTGITGWTGSGGGHNQGSVNSTTASYFGGGYPDTASIRMLVHSTKVVGAPLTATLPAAVQAVGACGDGGNAGMFFGGVTTSGSVYRNTANRLDFSSTTTAPALAVLGTIQAYQCCMHSSVHIYVTAVAANGTPSTTCEKYTIASTYTKSAASAMLTAQEHTTPMWDGDFGYGVGGYTTGAVATVVRRAFSTDTVELRSAVLQNARYLGTGCHNTGVI